MSSSGHGDSGGPDGTDRLVDASGYCTISASSEQRETECNNEMDDDGDSLADCDDPDCSDDPECRGGGTSSANDYVPCMSSEDCLTSGAACITFQDENLASYGGMCAPPCLDAACPSGGESTAVPMCALDGEGGFDADSGVNAYCALFCTDRSCPDGMECVASSVPTFSFCVPRAE